MEKPTPPVPLSEWILDKPFDSAEYLNRVAVRTSLRDRRKDPYTAGTIQIQLTPASLETGEVFLGDHLHLLPEESIASHGPCYARGELIRLTFGRSDEAVQTDILGGRWSFRRADLVAAFLQRNNSKAGDWITIERVSRSVYRVSTHPSKKQGASA